MASESVRAYSTIVPSFAQVVRGTLGKAYDFCGDSMRGFAFERAHASVLRGHPGALFVS